MAPTADGEQYRESEPGRIGNPELKQRLLDYNEDHCLAMRVVMDAMKGFEVRLG